MTITHAASTGQARVRRASLSNGLPRRRIVASPPPGITMPQSRRVARRWRQARAVDVETTRPFGIKILIFSNGRVISPPPLRHYDNVPGVL
jgi:hypothetical protein